MEIILLVNLAFSIVGFVFIIRMWNEVKTRRDLYGEYWGIPRGEDYTREEKLPEPPKTQAQQAQPVQAQPVKNMDELTALVLQAMKRQEQLQQEQLQQEQLQQTQAQKEQVMGDGDMARLMAAVAAAQKGGA